MLATGGGDAVIKIWNDSTATDKEEAFRKEASISAVISCMTSKFKLLFLLEIEHMR